MPIVKKEADQEGVTQAVDALYAAAQQAGLRCKLDASTEKTPGWKFNHYEMKVPHLRPKVIRLFAELDESCNTANGIYSCAPFGANFAIACAQLAA